METRKPVAPFYAVAVLWLAAGLLLPLYAPLHYILMALVSTAVFFGVNALCKNAGSIGGMTQAAPKAAEKPKEETTGNTELDKMLKDGRLAIEEMKRLDGNIADPGISADIERLEQVSQKIFDEVKRDPKKLSQIQRFMDYYLPTTLKLLNAYDRASSAGISGENVDATKARVEGMMRTIVSAFEKQLDSLYGAETLDISTDITVLENMMAREGLTGGQMKADATQKDSNDIKLEL
jgi:5-bromo-4-chloroindolyl phosphate hydrolysis protein